MAALTNVKGVNYTKYLAGGVSNLVTNAWDIPIYAVKDSYTVPTGDTVAVSTSLYMGRVPKGARILMFIFTQSGAGAAATGGVVIGSTAATSTSGLTDMTSATAQVLPCLEAVAKTALTADSAVTILLTSAADLDAATTVSLTTLYTMD
jgi:hypothetical protein